MGRRPAELVRRLEPRFAGDLLHESDMFKRYAVLPRSEADAIKHRPETSVPAVLEGFLDRGDMSALITDGI